MKKEIKKEICDKCGYVWTPRVQKPRQCPFCKSVKWNYKRVNN